MFVCMSSKFPSIQSKPVFPFILTANQEEVGWCSQEARVSLWQAERANSEYLTVYEHSRSCKATSWCWNVMFWVRHKLFSPAVSSYRRWSAQYGPQHRVPLLHWWTQHPHTHREQQQLQRDVRLHACPESGADTGQQTGCLISTVCNTQTSKYSQTLKPSFLDQLCVYSPVLTDLLYSDVWFSHMCFNVVIITYL